jgi:hypothetical protein
MCNVCDVAKSSTEYKNQLTKMFEEDKARLEFSKEVATTLRPITKSIYSSIKYPVKLIYPLFEARRAFSVPNNYFQNLTIDSERMGGSFAHGAMRSVFFAGSRLMLFSKTVNHRDGKEFFTSFALVHFEPDEFVHSFDGDGLSIKVNTEKSMRNLITNKLEKKRIAFNFINTSVKGRLVSREQVMTSSQFKNVYKKYGGVLSKVASIDMEGYAITVPHFSPHPYMLQLHKEFGYESNRDFQEKTIDYFKEHLTQSI